MGQELKQRVLNFLEDTGATKIAFTRHTNMSMSYFLGWMDGRFSLSEKFEKNITEYLDSIYKR